MPSINAKSLIKASRKAEQDRPQPSVGRETNGVVRAIRELLSTIRKLRADGVRWAAVAEALNDQGIYSKVDGKRDRLTVQRLTAIVHRVERQEGQRAEKAAARAAWVEPLLDKRPAESSAGQARVNDTSSELVGFSWLGRAKSYPRLSTKGQLPFAQPTAPDEWDVT